MKVAAVILLISLMGCTGSPLPAGVSRVEIQSVRGGGMVQRTYDPITSEWSVSEHSTLGNPNEESRKQ